MKRCVNCNKSKHNSKICTMPITSYGIILFRYSENGIQYLMIRRKDSFGYIDFIRGKYLQYNLEHLQNIFNEMSISEREKIRTNDFETLWKTMWGGQISGYKGEELSSQQKFEALKEGIQIGSEIINIDSLIDRSITNWKETEWEFPKGRRNYQEKDLDCALREFEEETGYTRFKLNVIENVVPYEEIFIGSNNKSYKHKYFVAMMDFRDSLDQMPYQATEVSKTEWKTHTNCLTSIRPYSLEKKKIISSVFEVISHLIIQ